ncbi:hypothetical protein O9H85_02775 [Paenibacillus filicis]|uniref:YgiT-type zinc finger protein n=1 Tax=Paenibacillus gyeongsangnamensis TaxID=3388067 RepID=A0ABT4Q3I3_9BACL|nr:hypothetical protein [Paenibacillus filicis]MCZ8511378.1 hypothetical protein [Paenibacillus filicis]
MQKHCKCGSEMSIRLRTVIYQNKVEIENVPVFSCSACSRSEVFSDVKPELTALIGMLGSKPGKQLLQFEEVSEIAHLMVKATEKNRASDPVETIIQDRINELLDLLLLAQSLRDEDWMEDIRSRLSQIAKHSSVVPGT